MDLYERDVVTKAEWGMEIRMREGRSRGETKTEREREREREKGDNSSLFSRSDGSEENRNAK